MKLQQSFKVQAPAQRVWSLLTDLASVAPCLPGAELTDRREDGSYAGTFTVKMGPTTAAYRGHVNFRERDDQARRAVMHASGQDKRGQGRATATMISTVAGDGATSTVSVDTDVVISGNLARFGHGGMIEDISNQLLLDFASCLQAKLAELAAAEEVQPAAAGSDAEPPAIPAQPASAVDDHQAMVTRRKAALRRTGPVIAAAAVAAVALVGWRASRRRR